MDVIIVLLLVWFVQISCNILGYSKENRYYRWGVTFFMLVLCIAVLPFYYIHRDSDLLGNEVIRYRCGNADLAVYIALYIFGVGGILVINLLFSLWKWGRRKGILGQMKK